VLHQYHNWCNRKTCQQSTDSNVYRIIVAKSCRSFLFHIGGRRRSLFDCNVNWVAETCADQIVHLAGLRCGEKSSTTLLRQVAEYCIETMTATSRHHHWSCAVCTRLNFKARPGQLNFRPNPDWPVYQLYCYARSNEARWRRGQAWPVCVQHVDVQF